MTIVFGLLAIFAIVVVLAVLNNNVVATQYLRKSREFIQKQPDLAAHEAQANEVHRLTRIVAHDLMNPVHAISSIASMLQDSDTLSVENQELVAMLSTSSSNLAELIETLLPHTAVKEKVIVMDSQPLDITALMQRSVSLMRYRAKEKSQTIRFDLTRPFTIMADETQLWRAFNNVLVNAIKFSPVNSAIEVGIERKGSKIQIAVKDEGIGMSPDMGNAVFEPNNHLGRMGTSGEQSFGMGLPLSKQIITAHKGDIWFEPAPEAGTTFYISLPEC